MQGPFSVFLGQSCGSLRPYISGWSGSQKAKFAGLRILGFSALQPARVAGGEGVNSGGPHLVMHLQSREGGVDGGGGGGSQVEESEGVGGGEGEDEEVAGGREGEEGSRDRKKRRSLALMSSKGAGHQVRLCRLDKDAARHVENMRAGSPFTVSVQVGKYGMGRGCALERQDSFVFASVMHERRVGGKVLGL